MTQVIYKYRLEGSSRVELPLGCRVLHVGVAQGIASVWVLCDPGQPMTPRLRVFPTGADIPDGIEYVGTFKIHGSRVGEIFHDEIYHVFDIAPGD